MINPATAAAAFCTVIASREEGWKYARPEKLMPRRRKPDRRLLWKKIKTIEGGH